MEKRKVRILSRDQTVKESENQKRVTQFLSAVSPLKKQEMTLGLVCDKICPFYAAILNI